MLSNAIKAWVTEFVAKRSGVKSVHHLTQRNLYILPTGAGFAYLLLVVLIWLLGTNYENNLILALSYLMLSLMFVAIFHTFFNLCGLQVNAHSARAVFAGEHIELNIVLTKAASAEHRAIFLAWYGASADAGEIVQWQNNSSARVCLNLKSPQRGCFYAPALTISSIYPLGLLRCWTRLYLDTHLVVYPEPAKKVMQILASEQGARNANISDAADVIGLHRYRAGEPLTRISWKHYARLEQLLTKEVASSSREPQALFWQDFAPLATEERLSQLCALALLFHHQQVSYSLTLPGTFIEKNRGEQHLQQVLAVLAVYDIDVSYETLQVMNEG